MRESAVEVLGNLPQTEFKGLIDTLVVKLEDDNLAVRQAAVKVH